VAFSNSSFTVEERGKGGRKYPSDVRRPRFARLETVNFCPHSRVRAHAAKQVMLVEEMPAFYGVAGGECQAEAKTGSVSV
jgi:hypothetical protein